MARSTKALASGGGSLPNGAFSALAPGAYQVSASVSGPSAVGDLRVGGPGRDGLPRPGAQRAGSTRRPSSACLSCRPTRVGPPRAPIRLASAAKDAARNVESRQKEGQSGNQVETVAVDDGLEQEPGTDRSNREARKPHDQPSCAAVVASHGPTPRRPPVGEWWPYVTGDAAAWASRSPAST